MQNSQTLLKLILKPTLNLMDCIKEGYLDQKWNSHTFIKLVGTPLLSVTSWIEQDHSLTYSFSFITVSSKPLNKLLWNLGTRPPLRLRNGFDKFTILTPKYVCIEFFSILHKISLVVKNCDVSTIILSLYKRNNIWQLQFWFAITETAW